MGYLILRSCTVLEKPIYDAYKGVSDAIWKFFGWVYRSRR